MFGQTGNNAGRVFERIRRCEKGTTAIEYGLIVALIASVVVGGMSALGSALISNYYDDIAGIF